MTALSGRVDLLSHKTAKAFTGVAMAFAMAGVPTVLPNEKFVLTTTWGTFQGENGAALSTEIAFVRTSTATEEASGTVRHGTDSESE